MILFHFEIIPTIDQKSKHTNKIVSKFRCFNSWNDKSSFWQGDGSWQSRTLKEKRTRWRNGVGRHSPDGDYQVASGWRETQTTSLEKEHSHLLLIYWKKPKEKILLNNKYIGKKWKCSNIRAAADSIARWKKKWHADTLAQSWRWKPTVIAFP